MSRSSVSFNLTDFYKSFSKRHPKVKISRYDYGNILTTAGSVISETYLKEGEFKLFSRMGALLIRMIKPHGYKRSFIDFGATRKEGMNVYQFNDHTDGRIVKCIWDRKHCILPDKFMWIFKPVRNVKRTLAREVKKQPNRYPIQL